MIIYHDREQPECVISVSPALPVVNAQKQNEMCDEEKVDHLRDNGCPRLRNTEVLSKITNIKLLT